MSRKNFDSVEDAANYIIAHDIDQETKQYIATLAAADHMALHFSLGTFIRNHYSVDENSICFKHPDDISTDILKVIICKLKEQE